MLERPKSDCFRSDVFYVGNPSWSFSFQIQYTFLCCPRSNSSRTTMVTHGCGHNSQIGIHVGFFFLCLTPVPKCELHYCWRLTVWYKQTQRRTTFFACVALDIFCLIISFSEMNVNYQHKKTGSGKKFQIEHKGLKCESSLRVRAGIAAQRASTKY